MGPLARAAVAETWTTLVGRRDPDEVLQEIHYSEEVSRTVRVGDDVAARLGQAIAGPLATLELNRGVVPPEHDEYVTLLCAAIRLYTRGHRQAAAEVDAFWAHQEEETDGEA